MSEVSQRGGSGPAFAVTHPRGRIAPPLPKDAPIWRRVTRGLLRLGQGLVFHDAFRAAPAMAFHFFLSLLPLLVFIGWVLGAIVKRNGAEAVLSPFLDSLPPSTGVIVKREVLRLAGANRLGPLAAVGFFWIASGGAHGLMDAVEGVVGAPRRSWLKQRLLALAWVVVSLVAVAAASFGVIEWDDIVHAGDAPASGAPTVAPARAPPSSAVGVDPEWRKSPRSSSSSRTRRPMRMLRAEGERALALSLSLAGAIAGLAAFYRFSVSFPRRVKRRVLPGAALAVGLWLIISWGFGLYVKSLAEYAVFYGSLAAVAVLLVWLWLTSLAILVGAELNAQLEGHRD